MSERPDYYNVGTKEDIVISNSSLGYINPEQGGSPAKFLDFFDENKEKEQSISLERGSLLHLWHEYKDTDKFIISDVIKPSDMMCAWVERVMQKLASSGREYYSTDLMLSVREDAYKSTKDPIKLIKKFEDEGLAYMHHLFDADGKIAVTPQTRDILEGSISSILGHKRANSLLFGEMPDGHQRFKEIEIYWEYPIEGVDFPAKFKAKLDNIVINWDKKFVYLNDLKSTGKPASLFKSSFVGFRYYRQMAFYTTAIYEHLKQLGHDPKDWSVMPRIVAVDSTPHFNVHVFNIDTKWQMIGNKEVNSLIDRVVWHRVKNEWVYTPEEVENNGNSFLDFTQKDEILGNYTLD